MIIEYVLDEQPGENIPWVGFCIWVSYPYIKDWQYGWGFSPMWCLECIFMFYDLQYCNSETSSFWQIKFWNLNEMEDVY